MQLANRNEPTAQDKPQRDRLIRLPEVLYLTSLGKTSIYELMNRGLFPKRIKFNARSSLWRESEVLAWIEETAKQGAVN